MIALRKWLGRLLPARLAYWLMILVWPGNETLAAGIRAAGGLGGVAVDVGANRGMTARMMRRAGFEIVCFEPNPELAAWLRGLGGVVHQVALGSEAGAGRMELPGGFHGRGRVELGSGEVEVRTLDSYGLRDVGLIKIDVEGAERAVIEGARETIAKCRPVLVVEVQAEHGVDVAETLEWIEGLGYRGVFQLGWMILDASRFEPWMGEYVRDFLFTGATAGLG